MASLGEDTFDFRWMAQGLWLVVVVADLHCAVECRLWAFGRYVFSMAARLKL